jgi:hypothetical protein
VLRQPNLAYVFPKLNRAEHSSPRNYRPVQLLCQNVWGEDPFQAHLLVRPQHLHFLIRFQLISMAPLAVTPPLPWMRVSSTSRRPARLRTTNALRSAIIRYLRNINHARQVQVFDKLGFSNLFAKWLRSILTNRYIVSVQRPHCRASLHPGWHALGPIYLAGPLTGPLHRLPPTKYGTVAGRFAVHVWRRRRCLIFAAADTRSQMTARIQEGYQQLPHPSLAQYRTRQKLIFF